MKRGIYISLLLLGIILSAYSASSFEFTKYDELYLNMNVSTGITIVPTSSDYDVKDIKVKLLLYPMDNWQQQVLLLKGTPEYQKSDDYLLFHWTDVETKELRLLLESELKIKNKAFPIRQKINFPLTELSPEYDKWLTATGKLNSDDSRIIRLASSIVEDEDDLFAAVFKLANFTNNYITYDLKTAGEMHSTLWILNNRIGVCGEFANLLITLCRAAGIPAKYIAGMAYSNLDNANKLIPHAWAEVYFPDIGWVPFDPTYGEFGYIDATHIKLKEFTDAESASVLYEWTGRSYNTNIKNLQFDGQVNGKGALSPDMYTLSASVEYDDVGFGSYQLVRAKLKNLKDYYITEQLYLQTPRELRVLGDSKRAVLLMPNEEKEVFWIVQVNKDLSSDYVYTLPTVITTMREVNSSVSFNTKSNSQKYLLPEIEDKLKLLGEEQEKIYSANIGLKCDYAPQEIYVNESFNAECKISNTGNKFLEEINLCIDTQCKVFNLGIGKQEKAQFTITPTKSATVYAVAKNELITKYDKANVQVLDLPEIEISNIEYPITVKFGDKFSLKFKATQRSNSVPQNIQASFNLHTYGIGPFENTNEISINDIEAIDLNEGINNLIIKTQYEDKRRRIYTHEYPITIELEQLNLLQTAVVKANHVVNWISYVIGTAYVRPSYAK
jgi:transglutaminase-like putative cysteine protease